MNQRFVSCAFLLLLMGVGTWLGLRFGAATGPQTAVQATPTTAQATPTAALEPVIGSVPAEPPATAPSASGNAMKPAPEEKVNGPALIREWLTSSSEPEVVATNMLNGFDDLPPEDHALAVSKLVVIVGQQHHARMRQIMLDPKTSAEAKNIIFRDAVNRPDHLRLPMLLAVIQQPGHPNAAEARAVLTLALGGDHGSNYGQWQAKISEELRRVEQLSGR